MKRYGPIAALTRREFFLTSAILPALTCVSATSVQAAVMARQAPYLKLRPYILPGNDEFTEKAEAFARKTALHQALQDGKLPVVEGTRGLSPCPASYHEIAADLSSARFAPGDIATGWRNWIALLGEIRRADFYVLAKDIVRFEVASFSRGKLHYRVGAWKVRWEGDRILDFTPLEEHLASADQPLVSRCNGACPRKCARCRKAVPARNTVLAIAVGSCVGHRHIRQQRDRCGRYRWRRR